MLLLGFEFGLFGCLECGNSGEFVDINDLVSYSNNDFRCGC